MKRALTLADYESLAELRYQIRLFLRFSEQASRVAGLEPRQHQLMLALKGLPPGDLWCEGRVYRWCRIQKPPSIIPGETAAMAGTFWSLRR